MPRLKTSATTPRGLALKVGTAKAKAVPPRNTGDSKPVCFAYQKGTCTKGKECSYAHTKDRGRSPTPKPGKGGKSPKLCTFFAAGTCKFGTECRDKHQRDTRGKSPKKRKGGKNKGKDASNPAAVAATITQQGGLYAPACPATIPSQDGV